MLSNIVLAVVTVALEVDCDCCGFGSFRVVFDNYRLTELTSGGEIHEEFDVVKRDWQKIKQLPAIYLLLLRDAITKSKEEQRKISQKAYREEEAARLKRKEEQKQRKAEKAAQESTEQKA